MKYFVLLIAILLSSVMAKASDKKIISITEIYSEYTQDVNNDEIDSSSFMNDTSTYTCVFYEAEDTVIVNGDTVSIQPVSDNEYSLLYNNGKDSLNVRWENGRVYIGDTDYYVLSSESYNKFTKLRSVLTLSHLLIDKLGEYPYDIIPILNLNWGVDYYECRIDSSVTEVACPRSTIGRYVYEAYYSYDKEGNFINQEDASAPIDVLYFSHSRSVISRDENHIKYSISWIHEERKEGNYTITCNKDGSEIWEGADYFMPRNRKTFFTVKYLPAMVH